MDRTFLQLLLASGILLLVSVFASKTSSRFGIPVLLIFIVIGMLSGSEGPIGIHFDNPRAAQILGTTSLIFILFSGGLSTKIEFVKPIWKEGLSLAFFGVLFSTMIMSAIVHYFLNFNWISSGLLAAAISSTDAAAVFGILKTKNLTLKPKIQSIIELESGSNDPMAVFLTFTLIQIALGESSFSWVTVSKNFFIQMTLGGLSGWVFGRGLAKLIDYLDLEFEGLYPVLSMAGILTIYAITEFAGGNGFLSVYLAGLSMGNEKFFYKKSLELFHDGLAWLMQVAMFLTLGLLVFPSEITPVMNSGILIAAALMFVARPLSVYLCLFWFKYTLREILFISWGGLRGAVPIILATYLLINRVPDSGKMFNMVFFTVIISMLIQGTLLGKMAAIFNVQQDQKFSRRGAFSKVLRTREFIEFEVESGSTLIGKSIAEIPLPRDILIVLIHRGGLDFMPRGNTTIELHDKLICLVEKREAHQFSKIMNKGMVATGGVEPPTPAL